MAAQTIIRPRFALDSNVLIDLGAQKSFAQRFLGTFRHTGLAVPPTVVQELAFIASSDDHPAKEYAGLALSCMRRWEIVPFDLISVGHGITEVNANKLMQLGIIPEGELNDGLVVVETALAAIGTLVTSDNHLLMINPAKLTSALADFDLPAVAIFHPKDLIR